MAKVNKDEAESTQPVGIERALREQVAQFEGPDDGTTIKFEYCYEPSAKKKDREYYTFVSVWIAKQGKWYTTGVGNGVPRESDHAALMKVLASHHVKSAYVATEFIGFKP